MVLLPTLPFHAIDLSISGDEISYGMVKLHSPFDKFGYLLEVIIVGTFNGIVFLVLREKYRYALYNPFTGAFEILDPPLIPEVIYCNNYVYGFGYGTSPADIKIVRLSAHTYNDGVPRSFEIFSLENKSWSTSPLLSKDCDFKTASATFVYWVAKSNGLELIVALNVKEMVFSEIQFPLGCCYHNFINLGTFNKSLSILCTESNDFSYVIMVMKEHGCGKLWSVLS